jgi:hypothetical protein
VYASDHGLEELARRRGEEVVTAAWLAARLGTYAGQHPGAAPVLVQVQQWAAQGLDEDFSLDELAGHLQAFVDADPEAEDVLNAVASWLARADDEDD